MEFSYLRRGVLLSEEELANLKEYVERIRHGRGSVLVLSPEEREHMSELILALIDQEGLLDQGNETKP